MSSNKEELDFQKHKSFIESNFVLHDKDGHFYVRRNEKRLAHVDESSFALIDGQCQNYTLYVTHKDEDPIRCGLEYIGFGDMYIHKEEHLML